MNENIIYLFAHQDDECAVFHSIKSELKNGNRVFCIYMTDGIHQLHDPLVRNKESLAILDKLGVDRSGVFFPGQQQGIPDGELYLNLRKAYDLVLRILQGIGDLKNLYILAWEGGHQDHDAVYCIGVRLAKTLGMTDRTWQFPLYHGKGMPHPLFRIFNPLEKNGPVTRTRIPLADRIRFILYCLQYPSQWRSWIFLFPMVALHFLFIGSQAFQKIAPDRIEEKPYEGKLLYEKRGVLDWDVLHEHLRRF